MSDTQRCDLVDVQHRLEVLRSFAGHVRQSTCPVYSHKITMLAASYPARLMLFVDLSAVFPTYEAICESVGIDQLCRSM